MARATARACPHSPRLRLQQKKTPHPANGWWPATGPVAQNGRHVPVTRGCGVRRGSAQAGRLHPRRHRSLPPTGPASPAAAGGVRWCQLGCTRPPGQKTPRSQRFEWWGRPPPALGVSVRCAHRCKTQPALAQLLRRSAHHRDLRAAAPAPAGSPSPSRFATPRRPAMRLLPV